MTGFRRALVYTLVFTLIAVGGAVFINNSIIRPIGADPRTYTADFTGAAGLKVGHDVRVLGARVGRVTEISVHHDEQQRDSVARVRFAVADDVPVYANTRFAIRYLNLTGIRYVDLQQPDDGESGPPVNGDQIIGTGRTIASFDVTTVFHGLAPVFAAMDTDDINHFGESLLAMIEGDGTVPFSDFVSGLTKVVEFADDRAAVIDRLVDNLAALSGSIEGRAEYINPIIDYVSRFGTVLAEWTPSLKNLADDTGALIIQLDNLLAAMGLRPNRTPDAEYFFGQLSPIVEGGLELLALTPGVLQAINGVLESANVGGTADLSCSKGHAPIPAQLRLFVRERQVTLCRP